MLFPSFILIGAIVGVMTTLFGIGGGLILVPVMTYFFKEAPFQIATASSLGFAFFNSLMNNYKFYKSGAQINYSDALKFSFSSLVGALIGGIVVTHLNREIFKYYFSALLIIIMIRMLIPFKDKKQFKNTDLSFILSGICGGCFSTLTGLGGGIIFAPLLLTFSPLNHKQISPYANLAISFGCFSGLVTQIFYANTYVWEQYPILNNFQFGPVNFMLAGLFLIGSVTTSGIGVKYNNIINPRIKNYALALIVLIAVIKTLYS